MQLFLYSEPLAGRPEDAPLYSTYRGGRGACMAGAGNMYTVRSGTTGGNHGRRVWLVPRSDNNALWIINKGNQSVDYNW